MIEKKNILVFPCGSEIGLEIHRSLKYSNHFNLIGASSVPDHGEFIYKNYIGGLPFHNDDKIFDVLNEIIEKYSIDFIYPTMDSVIYTLTNNKEKLNCKVVGALPKTTEICYDKKKTYEYLKNLVPISKIYKNIQEVKDYPIFIKPRIGYGSRGASKIVNYETAVEHLKKHPDSIIMDYLSNEEYTIDCFTNYKGKLLFTGTRERKRISNGISVNTSPVNDEHDEFKTFAKIINENLELRGAWFIQVKRDKNGKLHLLEVASRLAGSSSLYRNKGVNFAMLTLFDALGHDVEVFTNSYDIELDRALENKYKIDIKFSTAYIDFDDCLILNNSEINTELVKLLYQFINEEIKIVLITKHIKDINESLAKFRLTNIFDQIIHLKKEDNKYLYINDKDAIFIDDSHAERLEIHQKLNIPVFAPDNIESLLK